MHATTQFCPNLQMSSPRHKEYSPKLLIRPGYVDVYLLSQATLRSAQPAGDVRPMNLEQAEKHHHEAC